MTPLKVIERPESTTHVMGFMFHWIKDEKEAKNVFDVIGDKKTLSVARSVDPETFQPILYFAVVDDTAPFSEWLKYGAKLELMSKKTSNSIDEIDSGEEKP